MFTDPKSPWLPLLLEAGGSRSSRTHNFFASPLIVAAGFREGMIAALADRSPCGTISRAQGRTVELRMNGGVTHMSGVPAAGRQGMTPGTTVSFRTCDYIASQLSGLQGCPQFELFWPEPRRDEAIAACVAYLKRYGHLFVNDATPGWASSPGHVTLRMKFPTLDRPATREDVAAGRAIFSLEGEGETRAVKLPDYPQRARWVVLKDKPIEVCSGNTTRVEYDADGFVWQAEEVRKGDRWERHYGFVGHHVIARAPAAEVEFTGRGGPFAFEGGLSAEFKLVDAGEKPYELGRPIPVGLRVVNRLGVPREAPTEFVRPGPDGKPALAQGHDAHALLHGGTRVGAVRDRFPSRRGSRARARRTLRPRSGPALARTPRVVRGGASRPGRLVRRLQARPLPPRGGIRPGLRRGRGIWNPGPFPGRRRRLIRNARPAAGSSRQSVVPDPKPRVARGDVRIIPMDLGRSEEARAAREADLADDPSDHDWWHGYVESRPFVGGEGWGGCSTGDGDRSVKLPEDPFGMS